MIPNYLWIAKDQAKRRKAEVRENTAVSSKIGKIPWEPNTLISHAKMKSTKSATSLPISTSWRHPHHKTNFPSRYCPSSSRSSIWICTGNNRNKSNQSRTTSQYWNRSSNVLSDTTTSLNPNTHNQKVKETIMQVQVAELRIEELAFVVHTPGNQRIWVMEMSLCTRRWDNPKAPKGSDLHKTRNRAWIAQYMMNSW